jgi:uncharacterized protein YecT (DUF1311 family)
MQRGFRYLATILLSTAVATPLAIAKPVISGQEHEEHERDRENRRIYDPYHRDYHNWDDRENQAYRRWLDERHQSYRDYERLKRRQQRDYWNWRHEHEDHEEHHD